MARILYIRGTYLFAQDGVAAYVWDGESVTPVQDFEPSALPHVHYEVCTPEGAAGSWWVPVGTSIPRVWIDNSGSVALTVSDGARIDTVSGDDDQIFRAKGVVFWIPEAAFVPGVFGPGVRYGSVLPGDAPGFPPNAPGGGDDEDDGAAPDTTSQSILGGLVTLSASPNVQMHVTESGKTASITVHPGAAGGNSNG